MIINFSVSNYRSISEEQSLNMTAAKLVSKVKAVDSQNVIILNDKLTLLKSKALYGANASGKSNMLRALLSFIRLVGTSVSQPDSLLLNVERFLLSSDYDNKPTFFQLIFLIDGVKYRYGFEVTTERVVSEWLFGTPAKKEVKFFTRTDNNIDVNKVHFLEGIKIKELVKDKCLFLSTISLFKAEISNKITFYINGMLVVDGLEDVNLHKLAIDYIDQDGGRKRILDMLKVADIGIEGLEIVDNSDQRVNHVKTSDRPGAEPIHILVSIHKRFDTKLNIPVPQFFDFESQESGGSHKMFQLSVMILLALEQGRPLIIDEFDARFHPLLTKKLVQLFNSDINKNNTQFIFATHDTDLLRTDLLRKDQVCFVEKEQSGASKFYTLAEFKGVRNDSSIEKEYVAGRFGAIPFLGSFNSLFEEN